MSIVLKCAAVGGLICYWQIRRPEVYLKRSMKARIGITITKWIIAIGFIALLLGIERFFIQHLI